MAKPPFTEFPFKTEPGDPFRAFDRTYYLDRVDEDSVVTLRSRHGSGEGDLMISDEDGMARKPTVDDVLKLMATGDIVPIERRLERADARARRLADIDASQARELDDKCDFRMAVVRIVEKGRRERTQKLSDQKLKPVVKQVWKDFKKEGKARPKRKPVGSTVREWYRTRGEEGSRKTGDGVSRTGKTVRARKINHPIEILAYYASQARSKSAPASHFLRDYRAELTLIGKGRPVDRLLAEVDDDGNWRIGDLPADYSIPEHPYRPVSQSAFYHLVRTMRSKKAYAVETSAKGAMQRYEGGGKTEVPSRIGVLGQIDDTPVPNLFLMCADSALPLGGATATVLIDVCSRLAVGKDLSWASANTNTVLRTVLDANRPKVIPEKMLRDLPEEAAQLVPFAPSWAMRFDRILGDNLTAYHGIEVEDALLDIGSVAEFAAKNKPRSKTFIENVLGVLQSLFFKILPDARWDIALAVRFGYNPETQMLCTLQQARELFDIAVTIYNCTRHSGLDGKQPALIREQHNERYKVNLIQDEERLRRAMMRSEKDVDLGSDGIRAFGRRYSDAVLTAELYQDHERGLRNNSDHLGPDQKKPFNVNPKQSPTYTVRYKYDVDDLGAIYVWNPHRLPEGDWVRLPCTDSSMIGRPKILHDLRLEIFGEEADEFLDLGTEDILHAYLHHQISNVTEASSKRDKARHAKVMDNPTIANAMRNYVQAIPERSLTSVEHRETEAGAKSQTSQKSPNIAMAGVAAPHRKDGHINTPRGNPASRQSRRSGSLKDDRRGRTTQDVQDKPENIRRRPKPKKSLGWDDVA